MKTEAVENTRPAALKDDAPNVVDMFSDLQINENTISNVLDTFNSAQKALTNYVRLLKKQIMHRYQRERVHGMITEDLKLATI